MDDIVMAAMLKWPAVPHCHGWLALDARGNWFMRDDRAQAAGPFPQVKGSRVEHAKLLDFIQRNYAADDQGAWYFQNGPQRVYVDLEAAPRVWRLQAAAGGAAAPCTVQAHTGESVTQVKSSWLDDGGRLFLDTDLGYGIVHTLDTGVAADAVDSGLWHPQTLPFSQMPARFGYVLRPGPRPPLPPLRTQPGSAPA
jgi:hypothetical protein